MLKLHSKDSHEFKPLLAEIEDSPVSPLGRSTFWLVVMTFAFFVAWAIIGEVDIVVSASGQVIPDGQAKILQPLDAGVVAKILVKEGDFVKQGQVLMVLDPSSTSPELASLGQNLNYDRLEIQRLNDTVNGGSFAPQGSGDSAAVATQKELYVASTTDLQKQLDAKIQELERVYEEIKGTQVERQENQDLLTSSREKEKRMKAVLDIIAKDDYIKVTDDITSYESKVDQADHKLQELAHQEQGLSEEIEHIKQDFRTTNLKDLSEKQKQATDLQSKYLQTVFKHSKQKIVAPVDGYVVELFVHTVGGVVTPAEKLLSIVPVNTPLLVDASVTNKDIGFVKAGMPANIKVDTFDFQKYGMFDGKVKIVSRDSHEDAHKDLVYDVYVTPITKSIMVDGKPQSLSSGMTVNTEIKVGKRHIIEFFIYPLIKYMHEGMSVR